MARIFFGGVFFFFVSSSGEGQGGEKEKPADWTEEGGVTRRGTVDKEEYIEMLHLQRLQSYDEKERSFAWASVTGGGSRGV